MLNRIKKIGISLLILISIQTLTYYSIGQNSLINAVGKNYESIVLNYQGNEFSKVGFVSNLNPTSEIVLKYFKVFEPFELTIFTSKAKLPKREHSDYVYGYEIGENFNNPFSINTVVEYEGAFEFGAAWESEYIGFFYQWILIEKKNTGIS